MSAQLCPHLAFNIDFLIDFFALKDGFNYNLL